LQSRGYKSVKRNKRKKLLKSKVRRKAAEYIKESLGLSERQACEITGINRSNKRYESKKNG
jgi:hypothetical protein